MAPTMGSCLVTEADVQEAFLAAPPLIAKQIMNLTVKQPRWISDMYQTEAFPLGNGAEMQQLILRGMMPQVERGFDKWKKISSNAGCEPCAGPDCSYNWTQFGGTGIERKIMQLMERDFRSPTYCIKEIQTTAHYEQIFGQIVLNLYAQIAFFKEQNIGFNYFTSLLKKFVVDSSGARPNPQNPYVYRPLGTSRISTLNIEILQQFYEYLRVMPDAVPYDNVNGSPIYAMECSAQLLSRLYRDDPSLRQDARFSGLANDLLMKYNFMSTTQGMFINAPILLPRRFAITPITGEPVEILPYVNGIPMEIGAFTGINPDWVNPAIATHEEVSLHGKYPFKVMYLPTAQTLGQNTSFGPEMSFMNAWQWVNPLTVEDPFRRVGQFVTAATIGLAPQYSEAMFGILVERPKVGLMATWLPEPSCPPTPADCDNTVPDVGCPCPLILTSSINPVNGNSLLTLATPLSPVPEVDDDIEFGIDTGGYITGTVESVASDGSAVEVSFPDGTDLGTCDQFTSIFCDNTLGCSANVQMATAGATTWTLILSNAIKADTASDVVTLTYGNGTQVNATVSSVNMSTLTWVVDPTGTLVDNVNGVVSICVPTATDATCGSCTGPSYEQCET